MDASPRPARLRTSSAIASTTGSRAARSRHLGGLVGPEILATEACLDRLIQADGFESGDTSAWSAAVP
jgi:hypothetical protein